MSALTNDDGFLASPADLLGILAELAAPTRRQSARRHLDAQLAHEAYAQLFPNSAAAPPPRARIAGQPRQTAHGRLRQHCQCGHCRWCLDNARWERIFNEKFADPTYYGTLNVRHSSTLAAGI